MIDTTACCAAGALVVRDSCDESLIARKSRISSSGWLCNNWMAQGKPHTSGVELKRSVCGISAGSVCELQPVLKNLLVWQLKIMITSGIFAYCMSHSPVTTKSRHLSVWERCYCLFTSRLLPLKSNTTTHTTGVWLPSIRLLLPGSLHHLFRWPKKKSVWIQMTNTSKSIRILIYNIN